MKAIKLTLLIITMIIIVTITVVIINNLKPSITYEEKPLPRFQTDLTKAASFYNTISVEGKTYVVDDDLRRIVEYENNQFKRVLLAPGIEEIDPIGRVRAFSKVENKIYITTTERILIIIDPEKNTYALKEEHTFYDIADNKKEEIYFITFENDFGKLRNNQEIFYERSVPKLDDLQVSGDYVYGLDKTNNEIIKIKTNFQEEPQQVIRQPSRKQIISYDIQKEIYLLVFDHEKQQNEILIVTPQGIENKLIETKTEFGKINVDKTIAIASTEENKQHTLNQNLELINTIESESVAQLYNFFDPRHVIEYKNGYLISDDDNDLLIYVTCNGNDCTVLNEVKISRPRQITIFEDKICVGKYRNGIRCYNENLELTKSIVSFKDEVLVTIRGTYMDETGIYLSGSDSGCVYKYSSNYKAEWKVCGMNEPRYITKAKNYIVAGDANSNQLHFIDLTTKQIVNSIPLGGRKTRGVAYDGKDSIYILFKDTELVKTKVFLEKDALHEGDVEEKLIAKVTNARGLSYSQTSGKLYVADEGENQIKIYSNDKLIGEIALETENDYAVGTI